MFLFQGLSYQENLLSTNRTIHRSLGRLASCNLRESDTFLGFYSQGSTVDKRLDNFRLAGWWAGEAELGDVVLQWFQGGVVELVLHKDKKSSVLSDLYLDLVPF